MKYSIATLTIYALLVYFAIACIDCSSCFVKKLFDFSFPEEKVYSISLNKDPGSLSNVIMGYGDFNNDLRTDYIALNASTDDLQIFYYQDKG